MRPLGYDIYIIDFTDKFSFQKLYFGSSSNEHEIFKHTLQYWKFQ